MLRSCVRLLCIAAVWATLPVGGEIEGVGEAAAHIYKGSDPAHAGIHFEPAVSHTPVRYDMCCKSPVVARKSVATAPQLDSKVHDGPKQRGSRIIRMANSGGLKRRKLEVVRATISRGLRPGS